MKNNGLVLTTMVGSIACGSGCTGGPDRVSLGMGLREVRGQYSGARVKTNMPTTQITFTEGLTSQLDGYLQFSLFHVTPEFGADLIGHSGKGKGGFQSLTLGAKYFPFEETRVIGLDLGVEGIHGNYEIRDTVTIVRIKLNDNVWGVGLRLGLTGELNLGKKKKIQVGWSVGNNFTETTNDRASVNLDGLTASIAVGGTFGGK